MTKQEFFPSRPSTNPTIYAYELVGVSTHQGWLKVGFTSRDALSRVAEQLRTSGVRYNILLEESAMKRDGGSFTDYELHRVLRKRGFRNPEGEWFVCSVNDVRRAIHEIKTGERTEDNRILSFGMRPEQEAAVEKTMAYFKSFRKENPRKTPHFLWNAKMRFGKTFASYQLAKKMGWRRVLVITFKPAVEDAWKEDLLSHTDFKGWQFYSKNEGEFDERILDSKQPLVCFGSFQDYLGRNTQTGGIKTKNEWIHATQWDGVIFDEYHFGAWRENAKDLFGKDLEAEEENREFQKIEEAGLAEEDRVEHFEEILPISANHFLY
ncbi:MAG: GIY-YIG nuclease family protein, partial [Bacteroidota bacterium]